MIATCKSRCRTGGQILDFRQPVNSRITKRLGLVAWWKSFGSGGNILRDLMRNCSGTLTGAKRSGANGRHGSYGSLTLGGTDYASIDSVLPFLATSTIGAIDFWAKITTDNDAENIIFSISRDASATRSEIFIDFDMRVGSDQILGIGLLIDSVTQWHYATPVNSIVANKWHHIALVQNGIAPKIYIDGVDQALTINSSFSAGKWMKAIITDATSPADTANIGVLELNGVDYVLFPGFVSDVRIYTRPLSASQVRFIRSDDLRGNPVLMNWAGEGGPDIAAGGSIPLFMHHYRQQGAA